MRMKLYDSGIIILILLSI